MDSRPIGMFDSGVGGLTVFNEFIKVLPNEDIIYIGDTASFPYGSKSKDTIIDLTRKRIQDLIEKNVKLIIIACGTATSQALKVLEKEFDIPIIGIIYPTIKYIQKQGIKNIGVLATAGTIKSNGWKDAITSEIQDCIIKNKACPLLAPMAEEGWIDNEIARLTIKEYLKEMKQVDALILGCTHYPLFKELIKEEVKQTTQIINTGEMVAIEAKECIKQKQIENIKLHNANYEIYLTDIESNFINVAKKLIKQNDIIKQIKSIVTN